MTTAPTSQMIRFTFKFLFVRNEGFSPARLAPCRRALCPAL